MSPPQPMKCARHPCPLYHHGPRSGLATCACPPNAPSPIAARMRLECKHVPAKLHPFTKSKQGPSRRHPMDLGGERGGESRHHGQDGRMCRAPCSAVRRS
eukprot:5240420-Alexandrium_andersonii.AAC.1